MKIAIASGNGMVSIHFGHCEEFEIYEVEDNKIINKEMVKNPEHRPGFLPGFLQSFGVNVVISGGLGGGAVALFKQNNIKVITGAKGNTQDVMNDYLQGNLQSTESVCHEHQHHGNC
ncbi:MAG: NifB/NifX family molybdenum-iron cluster-binding protein [Firmicutes bacterium]|nr:NifB/NifX family molybdenum-iron cluster-binding protein [Bacillota bacterium]